jgi:hypothetical protein
VLVERMTADVRAAGLLREPESPSEAPPARPDEKTAA